MEALTPGNHAVMHRNELFNAVWEGNVKSVAKTLKAGANPNARHFGRPVLIWAVQEGYLEIVKLLIKAGASTERKDDYGFTPLDQAVGQSNFQMVRILLKYGAKVSGRTCNGTPLHTACAYRRFAIAKLLLDSGADPEALDTDGRKPKDFLRMGKRTTTDHRLRKLFDRLKLSKHG